MNPIEGAANIFAISTGQSNSFDSLASNSLGAGIDAYQRGDYEAAARSFRRAISYSPASDNALTAYDYMAMAYIKLGRNGDAINAYKDAVRTSPTRDDLFGKLGSMYYDAGKFAEAEGAYTSASRLVPSNGVYLISRGQAQLAQGKYAEAEASFQKVIEMAPEDKAGYYALGQAYSKGGRLEEAAAQFGKAVSLDPEFGYAYLELGSTYSDMGKSREAKDVLAELQSRDQTLAATLEGYMYKTTKPQMVLAYGSDGFNPFQGPGTSLSSLNAALSIPGSSGNFDLTVYFDKSMDMDSVMNTSNWTIQRAYGGGAAGLYNFGLPLSSTEVMPSPIPVSVTYDSEANSATLTFRLTQNAEGNGTIDPSHIMFRFMDKDAYGNAMDSSADEFSGFSRIV